MGRFSDLRTVHKLSAAFGISPIMMLILGRVALSGMSKMAAALQELVRQLKFDGDSQPKTTSYRVVEGTHRRAA